MGPYDHYRHVKTNSVCHHGGRYNPFTAKCECASHYSGDFCEIIIDGDAFSKSDLTIKILLSLGCVLFIALAMLILICPINQRRRIPDTPLLENSSNTSVPVFDNTHDLARFVESRTDPGLDDHYSLKLAEDRVCISPTENANIKNSEKLEQSFLVSSSSEVSQVLSVGSSVFSGSTNNHSRPTTTHDIENQGPTETSL